jgi:hypothetical protein
MTGKDIEREETEQRALTRARVPENEGSRMTAKIFVQLRPALAQERTRTRYIGTSGIRLSAAGFRIR